MENSTVLLAAVPIAAMFLLAVLSLRLPPLTPAQPRRTMAAPADCPIDPVTPRQR